MQRMIVGLLFMSFMAWMSPKQAMAAENSFETIFKDGFYGGLAGALVEARSSLLQTNPVIT